ncbi:WD40 repeat-like protein [Meredithblackwellia eburnea MCA 4105]
MASSTLQEVVISSSSASSPLVNTQLHSLLTAALLFTFKHSAAPTATSSAAAHPKDDAQSSIGLRKTMGYVESLQGSGGVLLGLAGKDGRAALNVWTFQKEQISQKLIPPVRLTTLSVSPAGRYVAGGTLDGRVFLWELASGTLIVTIDAHYRPISVLTFSQDDAALISAGEDAGVSVWSMGSLLTATPMNPPSPFATLSDHTLAITAIAVGHGNFPRCRVLTASIDASCKIWDLSTPTPSLLSTFSFDGPVSDVAWDPLERFFFAVLPNRSTGKQGGESSTTSSSVAPTPSGCRVQRVDLYRKAKDEFGHDSMEVVGGGGRGEVEVVSTGTSYSLPDQITAMHLSSHSPTLLLGTSTSQIHILSLPSLLPTRIIPPPLSSTPPGPLTFISTMLRPPDLGAGGATGGGVALPSRTIMKNGMGRTVKGTSWSEGGKEGRVVTTRVTRTLDVADLISPILPSDAGRANSAGVEDTVGGSSGSRHKEEEQRARADKLEEEVRDLQAKLAKAVSLNDSMWKRIVDGEVKTKQ